MYALKTYGPNPGKGGKEEGEPLMEVRDRMRLDESEFEDFLARLEAIRKEKGEGSAKRHLVLDDVISDPLSSMVRDTDSHISVLVDVGSALNKTRLLSALGRNVETELAENDHYYSVKLVKLPGGGAPVALHWCLTAEAEQHWRTSFFAMTSLGGFDSDDQASQDDEEEKVITPIVNAVEEISSLDLNKVEEKQMEKTNGHSKNHINVLNADDIKRELKLV